MALVDRSDMLVLESEAAGSGREVSAWTTSPTKSGEVVGNEEVFSGARVQRTLTDAEGRYDFRDLPTGITIEVATRRGKASLQEVSELKELAGGAATEIDFIIIVAIKRYSGPSTMSRNSGHPPQPLPR